MQISTRFTIAVHMLIDIDLFQDSRKITSEHLATSVNVNPVVIRRILQQLKSAGLVTVTRGTGGAKLTKPAESITLLDIYTAVESVSNGQLFHFHEHPNSECPVGRTIHTVLDGRLTAAQQALEHELASTTLAQLASETAALTANE